MEKGFQNLADIEQLEQQSLSGLPSTPYAALQRGAAIDPDAEALAFFLDATHYDQAVHFSFCDLMAHITQAANMLYDIGLQGDGVVSLLLPNLPETHFTIWGGEMAGIVNPINPLLEPATIADIMNAAETRILVTVTPFPGLDLWEKVDSIRQQVPTLKTILRVDLGYYTGRDVAPQTITDSQVIRDFHVTLADYQSDELAFTRDTKPEMTAAYFHTGGTTGTPKIAPHSHANQVADAWMSSYAVNAKPGDVYFCGLPLFHVNGVIVTGLIPWSNGAKVVLGTPQGYRAPGLIPNFWKIVAHYKVNFFSGVPTIYTGLLQVPIADNDVSSLQFAICGAAPMPPEVFREFEERTGIRILEGYGLTEGTCVSSVNPMHGERRIGSVGLRLPYQEMRTIILDDAGQFVRYGNVDEIGVIAVRGPNVFQGYKEDAHNQGVWIDAHDSGAPWLNTGDLGRMDAEGYFWLTGRRKELIIRGGHNIDPKLIEEPLHRHPAVQIAAAVGRPDPYAGEVPIAYVQLRPGQSITAGDLMAFVQSEIGERAAVPKSIHIVDQIPQTAVGKIFKPRLVWQEVAAVYTAELEAISGISHVEVITRQDKLHGLMAYITVTLDDGVVFDDIRNQIDATLGQYTIPYKLSEV